MPRKRIAKKRPAEAQQKSIRDDLNNTATGQPAPDCVNCNEMNVEPPTVTTHDEIITEDSTHLTSTKTENCSSQGSSVSLTSSRFIHEVSVTCNVCHESFTVHQVGDSGNAVDVQSVCFVCQVNYIIYTFTI